MIVPGNGAQCLGQIAFGPAGCLYHGDGLRELGQRLRLLAARVLTRGSATRLRGPHLGRADRAGFRAIDGSAHTPIISHVTPGIEGTFGPGRLAKAFCGYPRAFRGDSVGLSYASGRRILDANRSRRLTMPHTVRPSRIGRWRNPCRSMIWAASSADVSGLTAWGSGVIHSDTKDADRSCPDAAARRTSRSVRMPTRNRPCRTTAEPTFASTMPVAASDTGVSGVVVATRAFMR